MNQSFPSSCWIATDGAIGNEKQCLALAHYLGVEAEVFRIRLREPWNTAAPHLLSGARRALLGPIRHRLDGELPQLLITAGRRSALASVTLRRLGGGQLRTVQVLNPRISTTYFDLVICPRHDGLQGENVLTMLGAPHLVDEDCLALARQEWPQLESLPSPRVAVLIGASNSAYRIDQPYLERMLQAARRRAGPGGSLMVTSSRRTPEALRAWLQQTCEQDTGHCWTGIEGDDNPYLAYLAWADEIVVSADSVNMVSEACGTRAPVLCSPPGPGNARFRRFHQLMSDSGRVVPLEADPEPGQDFEPLRETRKIADLIRDRLKP